MHRLFAIISLIFISLAAANAQRLTVESMQAMFEPMTVDMQRRDFNNEICALVKVQIPLAGVGFEGNVVGDSQFKINEYWVYLTSGSKFLQVKCPGYYPLKIDFRKLGLDGVQSKTIYELVLVGSEAGTLATTSQTQPIPAVKPDEPTVPAVSESHVVTAPEPDVDNENMPKYWYVKNKQPTAVDLIEHPMGLHARNISDLFEFRRDSLEKYVDLNDYKNGEGGNTVFFSTVDPKDISVYGLPLAPFKPFNYGSLSKTFNYVVASSWERNKKHQGPYVMHHLSKKDAEIFIKRFTDDLLAADGYKLLDMPKKGNKYYKSDVRFFCNEKLGLLVRIAYKKDSYWGQRVTITRRAISIKNTGIAEHDAEWWCGIKRPQQ